VKGHGLKGVYPPPDPPIKPFCQKPNDLGKSVFAKSGEGIAKSWQLGGLVVGGLPTIENGNRGGVNN